jgi:hypothetical protein
MSQSLTSLDISSVYEPRLELQNKRKWIIVKGSQDVSYYNFVSNNTSTSQLQITCNPPSRRSVLDRVVTIQIPYRIVFNLNAAWTAANGGNPPNFALLQSGDDAFRCYPVASCLSNCQCFINGFPVNVELGTLISSMSRFHNDLSDMLGMTSIAPNYLDCYQMYNDGTLSAKNPLGRYGDTSITSARGAYNMTIVQNIQNRAEITGTLYEQIQLPPFLWGRSSYEEAAGLTNVDTLTFNFTFLNNLQSVWSHSIRNDFNTVAAPGPVITPTPQFPPQSPNSFNAGGNLGISLIGNMLVTFTNNPSLNLVFLTPQIFQIAPEIIQYPYHQINRYTTNYTPPSPNNYPLPASNLGIINTSLIQFESIPEKIYIFAKWSDSITQNNFPASIVHTDTFLQITSLSVNFANKKGLFSGATQPQLYQMTVKNGLVIDYDSWLGITSQIGNVPFGGANFGLGQPIGLTGSILCINTAQDLSLNSGESEGQLGQFIFQANVGLVNVNPWLSYNMIDLVVVAIYDGVLSISSNSCTAQIGVINRDDVLTAPACQYSYNELRNLHGGSFFTRFKNLVTNKIAPGIKNAVNFAREKVIPGVQKAMQVADTAAKFAPLLGLGYDGGDDGGYAGVGVRNFRHHRVAGGRRLPASAMRKRLMH